MLSSLLTLLINGSNCQKACQELWLRIYQYYTRLLYRAVGSKLKVERPWHAYSQAHNQTFWRGALNLAWLRN